MSELQSSHCPACLKAAERIRELEQIDSRQQELIETLQQQVQTLNEQLEQQRKDGKRQTTRFPRRKRKAHPKQPGRKGGHSQQKRTPPPKPDRELKAQIDPCCPDCGREMQIETHPQFQTDIPPVQPVTTQFHVQVGQCEGCGKRVQGRHEEQISDALGAANHVLGPNIQAMALSLKYGAGMSFAKISRFFQETFGFSSTPSTFVRSARRIADRLQPTLEALRELLRKGEVVHIDETGWRIGIDSRWLWVFSNDQITLYDIGHRGHEMVLNQFGKRLPEVICCDGFSAYDVLECVKVRCNGHIRQRLSGLQESLEDAWDRIAVEEIAAIFREAMDLHRDHQTLSPKRWESRTAAIFERFDQWLEDWEPLDFSEAGNAGEEVRRLWKHLQKHREEWFLYLVNPSLPSTNNQGERDIRPGVITRKVGGCNKTAAGAKATKVISSVLASCRKPLKSFAGCVRQVLSSRDPTAIDLSLLPDLK